MGKPVRKSNPEGERQAAEALAGAIGSRMREYLWKDALGELTLGFLHDLNNALAGVVSFSNLAALELSASDPLREYFQGIQESTRRATGVIERFARLLQCKSGSPSLQDAARLSAETFAFLRAAIPRRIEMELKCPADSLPVMVAEREFRLALFGLVFHAVRSMNGKGRIVFEVGSAPASSVSAMIPGRSPDAPNGFAVIAVHDSGPCRSDAGSEPAGARQVEPPREEAGGDIELDHARQVARELGGDLRIDTDPGQGTVTTLRVPLADLSE